MKSSRQILNGILLAVCAAMPLLASADTISIYVTRHGEKASDGKDPDLTPEGQQRARHIASMVKDAGIKQVFSTTYKRTQQTAQATADKLGVPVQTYDPGKHAEFAQQLRKLRSNTLVVGHSNTVPDLVRQLGGDPGSDIPETEYNRLYHITVADDGTVATTLLSSQK